MQIVFNNSEKISIALHDISIRPKIEHIFKHLGQVPIPFKPWDNPFDTSLLDHNQLVESLMMFGEKLGIAVDPVPCRQQDQQYLNHLHQIFEQQYNGNSDWLDYHEHIHLCEQRTTANSLVIDYRETAGKLIQPMDLSWLQDGTLQVHAGDVYIKWTELGKTPYQYWRDREPNNIDRLCGLAKPWINLVPQLRVSFESKSLAFNAHNQIDFEKWWSNYHVQWCQNWNIKSWSFSDMFSGIVIGTLDHVQLKNILEQNFYPVYVTLD
jgi:hypothetical protein